MITRPAQVAHHVRGRIRVRFSGAKGDRQYLELIRQSISPLPGVQSVEVSSATGCLVVHYDHSTHSDFHQTLSDHGLALAPPEISEVDAIAANIEHEAEFLSQHSETAKSLVEFVKQIDRGLKRATGNTLDLRVLLPLGLAVYSFLELESDISTPLWVTLGIFSFNSFVSLHGATGAQSSVDTETAQVTHTGGVPGKPAETTTTIRKRTRIRRS
jgi:hypothetical protein